MRRSTMVMTGGALAVTLLTAAANRPVVQAKEAVTFSEDVAPIVFTKCASCHRPGEAAPFTLQSYDDVKKRGKLIATAVSSRIMPPWKAAPADYAFKADRRLSAGEIEVIQRWVAA